MKWAFAMLLLLAPGAFADSISTFNITQATVFVGTDSDNVFFTLRGPGISLSSFGGIACQGIFCDGQVFAPGTGSPVDFGCLNFPDCGQIFLEDPSDVVINGHDLGEWSGALITLNTSGPGFTFPTNDTVGSKFTGCQSAVIGPSSITSFAGSGDDFTQFAMLMPPGGKFCSNWVFVAASDDIPAGFEFTGGKFVVSTVPEPCTLTLMGTGLAGMVGTILRKRGCKRHST